jgi:hypothetical protein
MLSLDNICEFCVELETGFRWRNDADGRDLVRVSAICKQTSKIDCDPKRLLLEKKRKSNVLLRVSVETLRLFRGLYGGGIELADIEKFCRERTDFCIGKVRQVCHDLPNLKQPRGKKEMGKEKASVTSLSPQKAVMTTTRVAREQGG